jgi:hypothetical protein
LFCLDCENKNTEVYNALDLCTRPECIAARVTRDDLKGVHEPNHTLVKVRTVVLKRQHGRVYAAARDAFDRVEKKRFRKQVADALEHPEISFNTTSAVSPELTSGNVGDTSTTSPGTDGAPEDMNLSQDDSDVSTICGNCEGRLTFPFWYCIFCKG